MQVPRYARRRTVPREEEIDQFKLRDKIKYLPDFPIIPGVSMIDSMNVYSSVCHLRLFV